LVFNTICHSCGGCALICPAKAITEKARVIGVVEEGQAGDVKVLTGYLHTGEASGAPIIKSLMDKLPEDNDIIIDCPPGSACIVMESIQKADYCVLVAEPTLFGVHNLSMVTELVRLFKKPFGVVLNKCLPAANPAERFCVEQHINILAAIPYDEQLAQLNSTGHIVAREHEQYRELFEKLLADIKREAS
ncbi:MAG: ATPase, partial [Clostridia bacterium]|nr:ATPase [Clostridia bacterium]